MASRMVPTRTTAPPRAREVVAAWVLRRSLPISLRAKRTSCRTSSPTSFTMPFSSPVVVGCAVPLLTSADMVLAPEGLAEEVADAQADQHGRDRVVLDQR